MSPPLSGEHVGHFVLFMQLGEGATGVVFAAVDERTSRTVAVKILHPTADAAERGRFLRGGHIAAAVRHPDVAEVFQVVDTPDLALVVMELVHGMTLRARLNRLARAGVHLPRREALRIAQHVCCGLAAVHGAGIIHCDIKPENVMLCEEGGVKLIDFGIAKTFGAPDLPPPSADAPSRRRDTEKTAIFGTAGYMSPEQAYGGPLDMRADVFSLGVLLYEMVTGVRPFGGRSVQEVQIAVDRAQPPAPSSHRRSLDPRFDALFDRVVDQCLAKDPRERQPGASALLVDIEALSDLARSADGEQAR